LLNAIVKSLEDSPDTPKTRWLLLVAHDTNIAMVRTLMPFNWLLPGYARGNIPPGSSLVFERWRDTQTGARFLHIYFQAQSLDELRLLTPITDTHPLVREEWYQKDCLSTSVGMLCPYHSTLQQFSAAIDRSALSQLSYPQ
jgi:4-phytase / acid phosphatase